jgi:hypothetical protein
VAGSVATDEILRILRAELPNLRREYGVESIALFGSYVSGNPDETSDIDLVVRLTRPLGFKFFRLAAYLEKVLGRPVDLVTMDSLELNASNPRRAHIAAGIKRTMIYVQ